jgi:hypothetical protein
MQHFMLFVFVVTKSKGKFFYCSHIVLCFHIDVIFTYPFCMKCLLLPGHLHLVLSFWRSWHLNTSFVIFRSSLQDAFLFDMAVSWRCTIKCFSTYLQEFWTDHPVHNASGVSVCTEISVGPDSSFGISFFPQRWNHFISKSHASFHCFLSPQPHVKGLSVTPTLDVHNNYHVLLLQPILKNCFC